MFLLIVPRQWWGGGGGFFDLLMQVVLEKKLGACLLDHNYKHVTNMYAPVLEIVVAMVIKAPHPPSL